MEIKAFNHMLLHYIKLIPLLLLLLNSYVTHAYDDTHKIAKRLGVDVCTENFKIHQSTIIRTEESKAMGARFITDEEVSSNDACMKLCCAEDECDVFIFEEKTSGTCFLFHCGLPDDFRCKFTGHSNYTSGILTSSRSDLQSSNIIKPKLSQNELELVNLKRPYHQASDISVVQTLSTSTIPPLGIRLADMTSTQTTTKSPTTCGRFQFQCQTSKECIAIYNVCDQIAQCEDGSDEGPECPANIAVTVKNLLAGVENQPKILDNQINNRNRAMSSVNMNENFNQMPRPLVHNREDPMSAPKYPQQNHVAVAQYMDTDTDSRIFNHKNNILTSNLNNNNYPIQYQRNAYNMMPQQQQQMDDQIYREQPQMTRNDWPQMPPQQQQQQIQQPIIPVAPKQSNWPENLPKQNDEKPVTHKKEQHKDSEYSDEYVDGDESQVESDDVTTTETPKKKQRKHKKVKNQKKEKSHEKPLHEQLKQLKSDANDDAQFILEHSGHVEKPTGAILSLTLGCLVLAALSVVIGCRMRRVNVRRRRHGKAVDSDYLVNGMYL
ncbi:hypothetical protein PVAND_004863 [Polypedilum vanderplanki]|uniref:MANSC domain-containing protein n=1 Tax=Polypedilum vanderplanki TaxID=319348 RepID=A0A9J6C0B9_POLVA|nr:hypothetical protein PVAND_004863 [Polypedilum vanderplanki]